MNGGWRSGRAVIASLTVLIVVVASLAFVPMATVATGDAPGQSGSSAGDPDLDGIELPTGDPLENETGTTEVVVRLTPIDEPDAEGDAVVAKLRDHAAEERTTFESFADERSEVAVEREFWLANALLVTVDAEEVDVEALLAVTNVTAVHENVEVETRVATTTESSGSEAAGASGREVPNPVTAPVRTDHAWTDPVWTVSAQPTGEHTAGLELIGAPDAWDRFGTRGAGATVAVIDTGVDPNHQDVDLESWAEFDENGTLVSDRVADAHDPNGHGTHVAGTVTGGAATGTHIGVAPDASLYGMNAFGEDGTATFASVLAAMQRGTADEDVDVLQMSLGADGTFNGFIAPVRNARAAGTIVVAAAGNSGHETSSAPANVHDALAVGAVRNDRSVATFSAGETINKTAAFREAPEEWPQFYVVPDVTAPGVDVISAEAGTTDGYLTRQGTSMAAPHVAGTAALAIAATEGRIEDDDLQAAIVDTARHPTDAAEPDERHGHGVVEAPAAIEAAQEAAPAPTPTPGPTPTPVVDPASNGDENVPGFGVVLALVALGVASLAASRRSGR